MRIAVAVPEAEVTKPVLDAALESVTRLNEQLLKEGSVPTFDRALAKGLRWKPEPPGDEHFDHAGIIVKRKWGDCDDIAPYYAATLRHTGKDPDAQAVARRSGPHRWHAEVMRGDGSIEDPSRMAGMGQKEQQLVGAALPQMTPTCEGIDGVWMPRPNLAIRPLNNGNWQARVDMPWFYQHNKHAKQLTPTDYAMAVLHSTPIARQALTGAIEGACRFGEVAGFAHPDHIDRLCAIADACDGIDIGQIREVYGDENARAAQQIVGSVFGKLKKVVKAVRKIATAPVTMPLHAAQKFAVHIPGVGHVAASTLRLAERAASGDPKAAIDIMKSPVGKALVTMIPGVGPVLNEVAQVAIKAIEYSPSHMKHFLSHPDLYPIVKDADSRLR
jgi:hypothetical protein